MAAALPPDPICPDCTDTPVQVPGPQGNNGANGVNGANGNNAYTTTSAVFTMPAVGATVVVSVVNGLWAVVLQYVVVSVAGFFQVTARGATTITLENLGYSDNVAPGTIVASAQSVAPAGEQGITGASGSGTLNDLSPTTGRGQILIDNGGRAPLASIISLAAPANGQRLVGDNTVAAGAKWAIVNLASASEVAGILPVANGGTAGATAVAARTALGLAIGTNVQAFDPLLLAIAALTTAADKLPYFTGADTVAMTDLSVFARTLLDDATAAAMLVTLGRVKPRHGLLGSLTAVNLNTGATDNVLAITATRFRVTAVVIEAASISLTTATAGLFSGAGGVGTIAADQALAACTSSTKWLALTLSGVGLTDIFTGSVYFRVGTPQGVAATANVWVFGDDFS